MRNISLNSVYDWLSYDIVRFKIEVGVKEKCMCKNVTQRTQHGDWAIPLRRLCCHFHDRDLSAQFGVIILGLCYPSNSLFEHSASTFGLNQWGLCDALFSNYFEDDLFYGDVTMEYL